MSIYLIKRIRKNIPGERGEVADYLASPFLDISWVLGPHSAKIFETRADAREIQAAMSKEDKNVRYVIVRLTEAD